jgi:hypothetical protein
MQQLHRHLEKVLSDIGPERFSTMKLMELEKVVRSYDKGGELPGKTLLRDAIHKFRIPRWPATAPKEATRR